MIFKNLSIMAYKTNKIQNSLILKSVNFDQFLKKLCGVIKHVYLKQTGDTSKHAVKFEFDCIAVFS